MKNKFHFEIAETICKCALSLALVADERNHTCLPPPGLVQRAHNTGLKVGGFKINRNRSQFPPDLGWLICCMEEAHFCGWRTWSPQQILVSREDPSPGDSFPARLPHPSLQDSSRSPRPGLTEDEEQEHRRGRHRIHMTLLRHLHLPGLFPLQTKPGSLGYQGLPGNPPPGMRRLLNIWEISNILFCELF